LSTHVIHAPGVAALSRWGLLDAVIASGAPAVETYSFDFGPFTIRGTPRPHEGWSAAYAPRRTVLDAILVDGAREAGAEVRERFMVDEIIMEDGVVCGIHGYDEAGTSVVERARVVVGADGANSMVARAVDAREYHGKPRLQWSYYTYWSDLPTDGFETFTRPDRGWAAVATNDDLTMLVVGWPFAEAKAYRADVEANYLRTLDLVPGFAERVRGATREAGFQGGSIRNAFRTPAGPGWVLVGDAGYTKDPITAQGISDAFRDAERCAAALDAVFSGAETFAGAMFAAQRDRDTRALPVYDFTTQVATLEMPPPEMQALLGAVHGDQEAMDAFVSVTAGTVSPVEFFDPEHVGRIMGAGVG
jgi:2-polyprenyl-6-methoxyphenol hydroxylase-like FAD-dependent oxidoreductase